MRRLAAFLVCVVLVFSGLPSLAHAKMLGVVLMHGKQGQPDRVINGLAEALERAGYPVERPEMCWSRRRIYDLSYTDCFRDIDSAVERLKARGATEIVVAGQSLGGNAAIG
jgi:esterase/lipase